MSTEVTITPTAAATLLLHSLEHASRAVFGLLLGTATARLIEVTHVLPVSHSTPLAPIAEAALLQSSSAAAAISPSTVVVGAYCAPAASSDPTPLLPARVVAQLPSSAAGGVPAAALLVISTAGLMAAVSAPAPSTPAPGAAADSSQAVTPAAPPVFDVHVARAGGALAPAKGLGLPGARVPLLAALRASVAEEILPGDLEDALDGTVRGDGCAWPANEAVTKRVEQMLAVK